MSHQQRHADDRLPAILFSFDFRTDLACACFQQHLTETLFFLIDLDRIGRIGHLNEEMPVQPLNRYLDVAATINPDRQAEALTALVEALAPTDPDRAQEVAATITNKLGISVPSEQIQDVIKKVMAQLGVKNASSLIEKIKAFFKK